MLSQFSAATRRSDCSASSSVLMIMIGSPWFIGALVSGTRSCAQFRAVSPSGYESAPRGICHVQGSDGISRRCRIASTEP